MGRIRQLEQENALLRAGQLEHGMNGAEYPEESQPFEPPGDEPGTITPLRRPDREMPPPLHSPLSHSAPRVEQKDLTPTPPTKPIQKTLLFGKPGPLTVDQLNNLRCNDSTMLLDRDGPRGATIQSVNQWMKTKILDSKIHTKLDHSANNLIQHATCTSWTTSQCHSVPRRVGHGAGSSSQIQGQGSYQVTGHFR